MVGALALARIALKMIDERRLLTTTTFDTSLPALQDGESTLFQRHYQHGVHGMGNETGLRLVLLISPDSTRRFFVYIMLAKISTGWDGFCKLQR